MSLKTHPSEKHKTVKFDEPKLLDTQIGMLTEVMNGMNTRPRDRQNKKNRFINLIFIEVDAEVIKLS